MSCSPIWLRSTRSRRSLTTRSYRSLTTPSHDLLGVARDPLAREPAPSGPPESTSGAPPDASSPPPEEEPLLETAADELNYRHLYETRYRNLEAGVRENAARHASGSDLFALCLDPSPQVVAALLENSEFGL